MGQQLQDEWSLRNTGWLQGQCSIGSPTSTIDKLNVLADIAATSINARVFL